MQRILRPDLEAALGYFLNKVPDYSSTFGTDPKAAYTALAFAALLSLVGWQQLPKANGLRLLVTSQLVSTLLLVFMGLTEIKKDLISGIGTAATIIGLVAVLISSTRSPQYPAEVASKTSIFSWTLMVVLPGIGDAQKALLSIVFFLVLMLCFGTIAVIAFDDKKEVEMIISM
jgi:membrane-bound ClpP family serine protease